MATGQWNIGTDDKVHLLGLKDEDLAFINAADSVIGTFKDLKKNVIIGGESITFIYVPSSSGNWDGIKPASLDLREGVEYDMYIVVLKSGKQFTGRIRAKANYIVL